jgi:hypothetical protein
MLIRHILSPVFTSALKNLMTSKELPVRTAHKLSTISRLIKAEIEKYEETRLTIIHNYALKDDNGKVKTIKHENGSTIADIPEVNIAFVNQQIFELENIDIEIKTISIDELGDKIVISPEELSPLEFIVE